jgi:HAD superfamily hydrolase (TIGR01509 family)
MNGSCLVFDFDGTILDTEESVYRVWAEFWSQHGHELALVDWQRNIGTEDVFDPWTELESLLGRPLDQALHGFQEARQQQLLVELEPRLGVLDWLSEAEELGIPVGIASSSPLDWVEGHLVRLGIRHRFSCLICRDHDIPAKPSPTSYRVACQRMDADPFRSVAVEDSPHGVAAATTAGLFAVATPHDLTNNLNFSDANLVIASLSELTLSGALANALRRPQAAKATP